MLLSVQFVFKFISDRCQWNPIYSQDSVLLIDDVEPNGLDYVRPMQRPYRDACVAAHVDLVPNHSTNS